MKKTWIVFALILAMMLQILPVAAFAETESVELEPGAAVAEPAAAEETQPEVTEPEAEETEPEAAEVEASVAGAEEAPTLEEPAKIGTFSGDVVINPLYPEYTAGVRADRLNGTFEGQEQASEAVYTNYSLDQAVSYITSCMEQRKTYFTFELTFNYQPGADALGELLLDLWYAAMEHNGIPTQGDYLYWHWAAVDPWEDSYFYEYSNGTCKLYAIYYAEYYTTASQETALTNKINQIIDGFGFNAATTDYEKAYTIYNWVTANIAYDYTGLKNSDIMAHTAYKGVMKGTCVCQGYASIIYRMFLQVGIPCRVVAGDASNYSTPNDNSDDHGWNIAQIAGKWYNLDSTWDEEYGPSNWSYFLLCPSKFTYHTRWDRYNTSSFHSSYPMASSNFSPSVYNGIIQVNGYWGYYKNGFLQKNYTGLVSYNGTKFYVQNGILDMSFTGLGVHNSTWYYIENGAYKAGYSGLVYFNGTWFYASNGVVDWSYTGLVPYNGNYFYVQNNVLDWAYTGLGYHDGGWYFIQNGLLQLGYTGLVNFNSNWFYVEQGVLSFQYTGMVPYNGNNFYVQNSLLDWSYTGLGYHNGGWYFIQNALMQKNYSGLVEFNGSWFYVEQGVLTFQYTGLVYYNGNYFYVQNSQVRWDYTGYVWYNGQYHYVQNGVMVWY